LNEHPTFAIPIRIYFDNTDAGGVVYHSEYLKLFERCRSEWLRHLGSSNLAMRTEFGLVFVVAQVTMRLIKPARLEDDLTVSLQLQSLGKVRAVFSQTLKRASEVLVDAQVTLASVHHEAFRPTAIPAALSATMRGWLPPSH
jgi:acyl-CoA thioester hydrolase